MIRKLLFGANALGVLVASCVCLAQAEPAEAPAPGDTATTEVQPDSASAQAQSVDSTAAEATASSKAGFDTSAGSGPAASPPEPSPNEEPEASTLATPEQSDATVAPTAEQQSWFYRPPIALTVGQGEQQLRIGFFGVIEANFIHDTTRSYGDSIGGNLVARRDTFEGTKGRTQFTARSSRFGFDLLYSRVAGIEPYGMIEADFSGDEPTNQIASTERSYYDSATFRMRHAFLELRNEYANVLLGQTDDVFGWQNNVSSTSRHTQLRLSRTFGAKSPLGFDTALAAMRPAQRDAQIPDVQAGVRLTANHWNGMFTRNGIPRARPLSLGVSGVARMFDVDAFTPPPTQKSNSVQAWGVSVDAVVPVIPVKDSYDRANALTLTGSFVMGSGIADLMRFDGGAVFPPLPNPARASPPPEYEGNVDDGLVTFDRFGVLHTIDWQAWRVDAQYYLPPSGRVRLYAVYLQTYSSNLFDLYPQGGAEIELLNYVADASRYAEFNVFWDVTPALRVGAAGIYSTVRYLDGAEPYNIRGKLNGWLFF